jgi:hypothetical protein
MTPYKVFLHISIILFLILAGLAAYYDGNHMFIYLCFSAYMIIRLYFAENTT